MPGIFPTVRIASNSETDQDVIDWIDKNYDDTWYSLGRHDCTNMSEGALKAANVDYVGASGRKHPNVFFNGNWNAGLGWNYTY